MNANPESESFSDFPDDAPAPGRTRRSLEGRLVRRLLSDLGDPPVEFVLWSGERIAPPGATPTIKIHIADRSTLFRVLRDPQVQFPDAYSAGKIEIEGDLVQLIALIYRGMAADDGRDSFGSRLARWFRRTQRNTLAGSRRNIHHHYDIGNEFYALWLGETMAYTCAYYPNAAATPGAGAGRQNGPRVPQAAAAARGLRGRGRLRLGQPGAAHGQPLWRARPGIQYFARADRLRARTRQAAAAWKTGSNSSRMTIAT